MTFYARLSFCMSNCAGCPKYREISPVKGQSSMPYWEGARLKANVSFLVRIAVIQQLNEMPCDLAFDCAPPIRIQVITFSQTLPSSLAFLILRTPI